MECDQLIKKAEGTEQTFKYTLWYLTRWAETSKIMGMEEVFVYLVEEYYMKGKATWLKEDYIPQPGEQRCAEHCYYEVLLPAAPHRL